MNDLNRLVMVTGLTAVLCACGGSGSPADTSPVRITSSGAVLGTDDSANSWAKDWAKRHPSAEASRAPTMASRGPDHSSAAPLSFKAAGGSTRSNRWAGYEGVPALRCSILNITRQGLAGRRRGSTSSAQRKEKRGGRARGAYWSFRISTLSPTESSRSE